MVFFVDVIKVFHQPFLDGSLGLAHIEFVAFSAMQAINHVATVAFEISAAFESVWSGRRRVLV